ncbi:MAG: hypothetical protein H7338_17945 [Candidatus Sericytochromatia bacterium]|nr:hypothetical protein [Candidatus Sericytochromatia bacterium]
MTPLFLNNRPIRLLCGLLFLGMVSGLQPGVPQGLALSTLSDLPPAGSTGGAGAPSPQRLVGFYASWSAYGPLQVSAVQAERLTHVAYAFASIGAHDEPVLTDADVDRPNIAQLAALKRKYPHLTVMLAVGGAGAGSRRFSEMARTAAGRQRFAAACARFLYQTYPASFDGLTLDWEYPQGDGDAVPGRSDDRQHFTALLADVRARLDRDGRRSGKRAPLAAALPAGMQQLKRYELARIGPYLDYIDLMTFDYASGSAKTGHNAPLYASGPQSESTDRSVQALTRAGIPAAKINIAFPFFGHAWQGVRLGTALGLGQTGRTDHGEFTYGTITKRYLPGPFQRHWDPVGRVPFLVGSDSRATAGRKWISYDDAQSLAQKGAYIRQHGLGGAFIWHLGADDPGGTLLKAAWANIRP